MHDFLSYEHGEHFFSNRWQENTHKSSKRWNPNLQRIETSQPQRNSPRSPVSCTDSHFSPFENTFHSRPEVTEDVDSTYNRAQDQYRPIYGLPSRTADPSVISPPPLRRTKNILGEEEPTRSKCTSFRVSSSDGVESYRPVYEEVRPSMCRKPLFFGNRSISSRVHEDCEKSSKGEQGLRIKGLASSPRISVFSAALAATLVQPASHEPVNKSVVSISRTEASDKHHPRVEKIDASEQTISTLDVNHVRSGLTHPVNTSTKSQANRFAVASLPVFPAFRKGGTPGSEITTSSKASTMKNICRNCGGGPDALHGLVKCQTCSRRYHKSCLDAALRIEGDLNRFMCKKCTQKSGRQASPPLAPTEPSRETHTGTEDGSIDRIKREGRSLSMEGIPESGDIAHGSPQSGYQQAATSSASIASVPVHGSTDLTDLNQHDAHGHSVLSPTELVADRNEDPLFQVLQSTQESAIRAAPMADHHRLSSNTESRPEEVSSVVDLKNSPDWSRHLPKPHVLFLELKSFDKRYKEVICPWWDKDDCHNTESECVFAHEQRHIRTPVGQEINKEWTCWFFWNSKPCPYHDRPGGCIHQHSDTGLYVGIDGRACRKFQTCFWWNKSRRCKKGESCPYSHEWTGQVSEDPAKKPGGRSYQRLARPSLLQLDGQSLTSIDKLTQPALTSQNSEELTSPLLDQLTKTANPTLERNQPPEAGHQNPIADRGNQRVGECPSDKSNAGSRDPGIASSAVKDVASTRFNRCDLCYKRIFSVGRCASCQPSQALVPAELDVATDSLDLSALVSNELGVDICDEQLRKIPRPTSSTDSSQISASRIIKRKTTNDRMFQSSKRHKPNVNVAEVCDRIKPPPNLEGSLHTGPSTQAAGETTVHSVLIDTQTLGEATEITDLPSTKAIAQAPRTIPRRPIFSPCAEAYLNRDIPAPSVEQSLSLSSDGVDAETSLPADKEKTPLWSQSTEESEEGYDQEEEDSLSLSDWTIPPSPCKTFAGSATSKKVSCTDCRRRHRKCEHNVDGEKVTQSNLKQALESAADDTSRTKEQMNVGRFKDQFSRADSTRSGTITSRLSDASLGMSTPATSVAPSIDGIAVAGKGVVHIQQRLTIAKARTIDQCAPEHFTSVLSIGDEIGKPMDGEDSLEDVIARLRLQGIVVESDCSDDDSENDALPQMSDPPPRSRFDRICLPPMTHGQGMKNKDRRAVLIRSMIFNQQVFGNKHHTRNSKDKHTQVVSHFERKIQSTRDQLAAPKLQETLEQATFAEFLGLPQDFEPEPTLGPGEGNARALYMRNRAVNEPIGYGRRRRLKGNETWPIRGE